MSLFEIDWLYKRAIMTPNMTALIDAGSEESWTFQELNMRADQLAGYFKYKGIQKGDRIALLSINHVFHLDFLFACLKIGAIFVPLNWRLSRDELQEIILDCTPNILGIHPEFSNMDFGEREIGVEKMVLEPEQYRESLRKGSHLKEESCLSNEYLPAVIIYTGGTTGKPKGVVLSQRSLITNSLNTIVSWGITDETKTLTCLPLFHTGGLNALTLPVLMAGGTVILSSKFEEEQAVKDIIRFNCTIVLLVPTMYHMMIQTKIFQESSFPDMRVFLSGGAPCPLEIYEVFHQKGLVFKEGYGLSEAGPNNFSISPLESMNKRGSVGKPMLFNAVKILDGKNEVLEPDKVGELLISGDHTFVGYWNNEEATNEAFHNGWLYTGDLAKRDEDGCYYIVGRKKDMIITGGENVYPLEVERHLLSHPDVNEVAIIGFPHEKWGEMVTAFVSIKSNKALSERDVIDYCCPKLAKYKIPKKVVFLAELPKTPVGKIDKKRLKEMVDVK